MLKCKLSVGIVLFVSLTGACLASVTRSVSSISDADAERAGFLLDRARACHENEAVLKRFFDNVLVLTGNQKTPVDKDRNANEFISYAGAKFLETITCQVQTGQPCPSNPYLQMSCREFLHSFRQMRVTRSDWQASQGLN